MPNQTIDPVSSLLAEFEIRLNEVEEKQRLLRDRSLLIGDNLISTKKENDKEIFEIKKELNKINSEIKDIKQIVKRIVNEIGNLSRRSELEIIKKQYEMFTPLEFARIKDVKRIIREELKKK